MAKTIKAESFGHEDEIDYLEISKVKLDFPQLAWYIKSCRLHDVFIACEPPAQTTEQLAMLNLTAKMQLLNPGEIKEKWPLMSDGITSTVQPSVELDGTFHVAVELVGRQRKLLVGWLLSAVGHYVEQIASGNGYLKGWDSLRGTSFDQAVILVSMATKTAADDTKVRESADLLVAAVNGAWVASATCINLQHAAVALLMRAINLAILGNGTLLQTVALFDTIFASAIVDRRFYEQHVESIGWTTEKGMCLTMDAATTLLLRKLTDSLVT